MSVLPELAEDVGEVDRFRLVVEGCLSARASWNLAVVEGVGWIRGEITPPVVVDEFE